MTTTIKPVYGATTALTITSAAALASLAAAGCAARDNSADLFEDVIISFQASLANGSVAADKLINIWLAGSEDGTHWNGETGTGAKDNYAGSDAAVTLDSPTNLLGPFQIGTPQNVSSGAPVYGGVIPSFCRYWGTRFVMPRKWGIVVENRTGLAFAGFSASFTGINRQGV
jgi:hypothetical protein